MKKALASLTVIAALAGCGGAETKAAAPTTVPVTITKTSTAPAPAPVTVTTTVRPDSAPAGCLALIDDMQTFTGQQYEFATVMAQYPSIVQAAMRAGLNYSAAGIRGVTARLKEVTEKVNDLTDRTAALRGPLKAHIAACRAGR